MKITKPDFKIIFNKMINNSYEENNNLIKKLSNGSKSGINSIDQIVTNYSSEYITKIMNKIINKGLSGGQTSEEPINKINSLLNMSESEKSIVPLKNVRIIDMIAGNNEIFIPTKTTFESNSDSATSSAIPNQSFNPSSTSDVFMPAKPTFETNSDTDSATSSVIPNQSFNPSSTSDVFMSAKPTLKTVNDSATSSVIPNQSFNTSDSVTSSTIMGLNISSSTSDTKKKISPNQAIKLVVAKNDLLNKKEKELKYKQTELEEKEVQVNQELAKAKVIINDLTNQKLELENTINKLKEEKNKLDASLEDLTVDLSDIQNLTSSNQSKTGGSKFTEHLLKKIFN